MPVAWKITKLTRLHEAHMKAGRTMANYTDNGRTTWAIILTRMIRRRLLSLWTMKIRPYITGSYNATCIWIRHWTQRTLFSTNIPTMFSDWQRRRRFRHLTRCVMAHSLITRLSWIEAEIISPLLEIRVRCQHSSLRIVHVFKGLSNPWSLIKPYLS